MFWFYIWVPIVEIDDNDVYLNIDWFWYSMSGSTRDVFINAWINDILLELGKNTIWSGNTIFVKYSTIKDNLEKIRYLDKIYKTEELWIDILINDAIKKHGEDKLFCMFN